jgi:diguanylate cyclase (GGDEF)-like protein
MRRPKQSTSQTQWSGNQVTRSKWTIGLNGSKATRNEVAGGRSPATWATMIAMSGSSSTTKVSPTETGPVIWLRPCPATFERSLGRRTRRSQLFAKRAPKSPNQLHSLQAFADSTDMALRLNTSGVRSIHKWMGSLQPPVVATPALMSVVTGGFYVSGGVLALIISFVGGTTSYLHGQRTVAVAVLVAGLLIARFPRRRAMSYHLLTVSGTVLITFMIILTGGGNSAEALAILYVFVTLESFFFFPWQLGLVYHLLAVAGVIAVVAAGVLSLAVGVALLVIQTATGWVVGWLVTAAGDGELDSVTGLANRRGLDRALSINMAHAQRDGQPLILACIDLDHFKTVNDTAGHTAGDRLLRAAAETWSQCLPPEAFLARAGGDEFAVLLPGYRTGEAFEVVEALRNALVDLGHGSSAGIAMFTAGLSSSSLMSRADVALYQAKRTGRGRTCVYDGEDNDDELRSAFDAGELFVVYQPIVELATGEAKGAEALLRWLHPARGLVPPDEFIPLAEATGLICDLGQFVLQEACTAAAAWPVDTGKIAVNVSGPELLKSRYVDQVRSVLATTGLPAGRLVLEVTETSIGADADASMRTLQQLRKLGVRVAVDDFGVGYSSLSRLDRLPVDVLKLDRSFVAAIPDDGSDAPLIAAVAALASAVGLETVAEGIEHPYQARLLAQYGFKEGQGYLYGCPGPADRLWLAPTTAIPTARERVHAQPS